MPTTTVPVGTCMDAGASANRLDVLTWQLRGDNTRLEAALEQTLRTLAYMQCQLNTVSNTEAQATTRRPLHGSGAKAPYQHKGPVCAGSEPRTATRCQADP